ncbi:hypothetical protein PLESTB_000595200 [Pleodorina starrii]|uniref:Uncharacterized protein n=1 Tax=Pleodorina starrii TaxID=330485 RepID=A0A9W6BI62_9CHLO|nr:hypothetical protein PLESTB_000595200 [Pleodorina starrii]
MAGGGWAPYYPSVAGYQLPPGYPEAWVSGVCCADGIAPWRADWLQHAATAVLSGSAFVQQAVPVGLTPAQDQTGDQLPVQSVRIKTAPPEAAMKIKEFISSQESAKGLHRIWEEVVLTMPYKDRMLQLWEAIGDSYNLHLTPADVATVKQMVKQRPGEQL